MIPPWRAMTWNMQGAGTTGDETLKWQLLADFMTDPLNADVKIVTLQECGLVPDKLPSAWTRPRPNENINGWDAEYFVWTAVGAAGHIRSLYITYVHFDYGKGPTPRVNMAIVSEAVPLEGRATVNEDWRPVFGIRVATPELTGWAFCIHANAAGGYDAAELIMSTWTAISADEDRLLLGDFNREPGPLAAELGNLENRHIFRRQPLTQLDPGVPTHHRTDPTRPPLTLDHGFCSPNVGLGVAIRHDMGISDHWAVLMH